ncbi:MAG: alpha/beta fold hydrolase [SAR202 cluster bacterium]|nr:alpha/beta fold hydrolase [SAR202 cluster bacterium]
MATYVLVHGAFHGAWCWDKFIPYLEKAGHKAIAVDLPAHGKDRTPPAGLLIKHNVDKVVQALDSLPEKVVLVGHSLAGITISGVAEARPDRIKTLVYLTAHLLRDGESVPEVTAKNEPSRLRPIVSPNPDGVTINIDVSKVKGVFYQDCADEDVARAQKLLQPEPTGPRGDRVRVTDQNFGRVPRVYIECLQDFAIMPSFQKNMYTATPCKKVYTMNTGHSPFLSAPAELAKILGEV